MHDTKQNKTATATFLRVSSYAAAMKFAPQSDTENDLNLEYQIMGWGGGE